MKNIRKKALSLILTFSVLFISLFSFNSCDGKTPDPTPDAPSGPKTYTVEVKSEYGLEIGNVYLLIHDEASNIPTSSVLRVTADREGKASFDLDSAKTYSVRVTDLPEGYTAKEKYSFNNEGHAEIILSSSPITDADVREADEYEIGDVIPNIDLIDVNGNRISVSDALKSNKLLVLNFWYAGCAPCREEFPHLISAYAKYKNLGVEIFAVNDNGDPPATVKNFTVSVTGEDGSTVATPLPFPTFRAEDSGYRSHELFSKFGSSGYPVTVLIDRAGVICCIFGGKIESEKYIRDAIFHFTSEDYVQKLTYDIRDYGRVD